MHSTPDLHLSELAIDVLEHLPAPLGDLSGKWEGRTQELGTRLWNLLVSAAPPDRFFVPVDPTLPCWSTIDIARYTMLDGAVMLSHLPVYGSGPAVWVIETLRLEKPHTTAAVLSTIPCRNRYVPNWAMAESFLDAYPGEQELGEIVWIAGTPEPNLTSAPRACLVAGPGQHRQLRLTTSDELWPDGIRHLMLWAP